MRSQQTTRLLFALTACVVAAPAWSQVTTYDWVPTDPANWNVDANWNASGLNFVPDGDTFPGDAAQIGNGGTAIVNSSVPRVAQLTVSNGTVDIQSGGQLATIEDQFGTFGNGNLVIGGAGVVNLSGSGTLGVDGSANNAGTLRLTGPGATLTVDNDFTNTGTLAAAITDANNHSTVDVTGTATLGGTLQVELSGINPAFGQSWDIVSAGSLAGRFASVDASAAPPLARGLRYEVIESGGVASLSVGNALILTVDRDTGAGSIANVVGDPIEITSYAIRSQNGLLSSSGWTSVSSSNAAGAGWRVANPTEEHLAELNLTDSFNVPVGGSFDLGSPYDGGPSTPDQEDVQFQYTTLDGRLVEGLVEYTGPVNDLTLFVDPDSGDGAIGNLSRFIATPNITSYAVLSESGSLTPATWNSLTDSGEGGDGWREANPAADHLPELNLSNSLEIPTGVGLDLGQIFSTGGEQDLIFQYTSLSGELLFGTVQYGAIPDFPGPGSGLAADFDKDGDVDGDDFLTWQSNFGQSGDANSGDTDGDGDVDGDDFLTWQTEFGTGVGGATSSATAVPEPTAALLLVVAALGIAFTRRS